MACGPCASTRTAARNPTSTSGCSRTARFPPSALPSNSRGPMLLDIAQTAVDGLMVGGLYATVAVGVTLVFGIMGILNFAHGQMVMLGAYVAFYSVTTGLGFWPGLVLAGLSMGLFGLILERLVFRHT